MFTLQEILKTNFLCHYIILIMTRPLVKIGIKTMFGSQLELKNFTFEGNLFRYTYVLEIPGVLEILRY